MMMVKMFCIIILLSLLLCNGFDRRMFNRGLTCGLNGGRRFMVKESEAEFSRIIGVSDISSQRPTLCRLIAKEPERLALQKRYNIHAINYLKANVTVEHKTTSIVQVSGNLCGEVFWSRLSQDKNKPIKVEKSFQTTLLNNYRKFNPIMFKHCGCDDEVDKLGKIDIGEIVAQYFYLQFKLVC